MAKVEPESDDDDVLYRGSWLTIRAVRKRNGRMPAKEWYENDLEVRDQTRFQAAARMFQEDLLSGRRSGRMTTVTDSRHRLTEFRITPGGGRGPHLRMLGIIDGQTVWVAHGFKKQTNRMNRQDIDKADGVMDDSLAK